MIEKLIEIDTEYKIIVIFKNGAAHTKIYSSFFKRDEDYKCISAEYLCGQEKGTEFNNMCFRYEDVLAIAKEDTPIKDKQIKMEEN